MTNAIKIFCIAASFTLFALSTVGLEVEGTLIQDTLVEDTHQVTCNEELVSQVLETNP